MFTGPPVGGRAIGRTQGLDHLVKSIAINVTVAHPRFALPAESETSSGRPARAFHRPSGSAQTLQFSSLCPCLRSFSSGKTTDGCLFLSSLLKER